MSVSSIGMIRVYEGHIEKGLNCPISREPLEQPVLQVSCCKNLFSPEGLKSWLIKQKTCPLCRANLDVSELFSLKERLIQQGSTVLKYGVVGIASAMPVVIPVIGKILEAYLAPSEGFTQITGGNL